ncbi:purine-nucleoside phosphorylase [Nevskia ramosa]|uniref:purine-nucleoside phosphorylase n=1 Tax=Nevskia ramosa TaxID=64002 RepID=UPI0003B6923F|nr:purine nucleoside permease [Nevskia ramosa]
MSLRLLLSIVLLTTLAACSKVESKLAAAVPIPIKVVVVSMFEKGKPTGDEPGEFQFWIERQKLTELPFPMGEYPIYINEAGLLAICTGGGITNAATSVMALGVDPRFDLSKAYWLITGIGGGDPQDVSLGTAAWARHVVDGDLLYEIDAREIPKDWPYGLLPLGAKKPNDKADGWTVDTIHFPLNAALTDWAYALTKDHPIADSPGIAAFRKQFEGFPNAVKPPFVTIGDTMSSSTYFHGDLLTKWANDWMKLQAGPDANFMVSAMEDSGSLTALRRLARSKLVDPDRVMVLRTVSNYSMQPPGKDAAWSTTAEYPENGVPALEAAYQVGNIVVQKLITEWPSYVDHVPGAADKPK